MANAIRWSLKVSKETDISLRTFLAYRGMRKGDISKFVEEAVRWRVLDRTAAEIKDRNQGASAADLESAIAEAVEAVRAEKFRT